MIETEEAALRSELAAAKALLLQMKDMYEEELKRRTEAQNDYKEMERERDHCMYLATNNWDQRRDQLIADAKSVEAIKHSVPTADELVHAMKFVEVSKKEVLAARLEAAKANDAAKKAYDESEIGVLKNIIEELKKDRASLGRRLEYAVVGLKELTETIS